MLRLLCRNCLSEKGFWVVKGEIYYCSFCGKETFFYYRGGDDVVR